MNSIYSTLYEDENVALVGYYWRGESEVLGQNPALVLLYPPHILRIGSRQKPWCRGDRPAT